MSYHLFQMLKEKGYQFDIAYTSLLKRAIKTLNAVQEELDLHWIPVVRHWRLNERHYGALQGLNKAETAAKYGEAQVKVLFIRNLFHLLFQLQDFHHCWKIVHTLKIWTWFITDRMISFAEEFSFKRLLNILNFNGPQEKVQCIVLYMLYISSSNFKINIRSVIYSLYT